MDFSGPVIGTGAIGRFNQNIFHKIDNWNDGPNFVNDYFRIKQPTPVVIAPGSDMPYCLVHWVGRIPENGDGWPAQAANPGAYVSLLKEFAPSPDAVAWQPILLGNHPVVLEPGYYVPALPMLAYCGDQYDIDHTFNTTMFEYPEVLLMESHVPVELNPYQFTTKEVDQTDLTYFLQWLITPTAAGLVASTSNFTWSKLLGFGASNQTGNAMTGTCKIEIMTKDRTFPDGAAARNFQDFASIGVLVDGARDNDVVERFGWFKVSATVCAAGAIPAGIGILTG